MRGVYDAEDTPRQQAVLEGCKQFVNEVLRSGRVSRSELIRFIRQNVGHAQENPDRATAYRIDNYHAQATAWRTELGPEKWAALRVVIPGSSMARRHSLTTQYFAKLLGEPGESDRIVYAESLFDEQKALERLGTHLFDMQIGEDFFRIAGACTEMHLAHLLHTIWMGYRWNSARHTDLLFEDGDASTID